ncbi:MAG TPA: aminomethyltransferase beta-barrel domain-containing protein, partial [Acidimicrobiales bacterium]|nr:aminomethyltransferase beta-barrel domain-containing protein [Acidimicrobiales bacterium]
SGGRAAFLGDRIELHPADMVEVATGRPAGRVDAVELVTVGQRRGIGPGPDGRRRFAVDVDVRRRRVVVGGLERLMTDRVAVGPFSWTGPPVAEGSAVEVQCSAHGRPSAGWVGAGEVRLAEPVRRVAPGQTVALYRGDEVLGSAVVAA